MGVAVGANVSMDDESHILSSPLVTCNVFQSGAYESLHDMDLRTLFL